MRRKRSNQILFWPAMAACAVIFVLIGASDIRTMLGGKSFRRSNANATSVVYESEPDFSRLPPPSTLHTKGEPGLEADLTQLPPNRGLAATEAPASGAGDDSITGIQPEHVLPHPDKAHHGGVRLLAPVLDPRDELAGSGYANQGADDSTAPAFQATTGSVVAFKPADRDTDRSANDGQAARQSDQALSMPTNLPKPGVEAVRTESASAFPGEVLTEQAGPSNSTPRSQLPSKPAGIAWPRTPSLHAKLNALAEVAPVRPWCEQVRASLAALQALPSLQSPSAGDHIAELYRLAVQGLAYGEEISDDRKLQSSVLRTAHALQRRALVWQSVWLVTDSPNVFHTASHATNAVPALSDIIQQVQQHSESTGDAGRWQRYLLLDEVSNLEATTNLEVRKLVAQRLLSRLEWDGLNQTQQDWLSDESVRHLASRIRPWAEAPVDFVVLLNQIERLESDAIDMDSIEVANTVQSLRFSGNPRAVAVARTINNYYRNANIRMAVSGSLIKSLLPEVPSRETPIRHVLAGVPVRGTGTVESHLDIELVPSDDSWHVTLGTHGAINSRTGSEQWPVRISNTGTTQFAARTPIRIDRRGVTMDDTIVDANSHVHGVSMRTEFDGLPIIESLVRSIAKAQYRDRSPIAKRQGELLAERDIEQSVSAEVDTKLRAATQELSTRLLGPLGRLQLDPLVVDLETTESRLAARYRVAGDWQMAAFTPRPRALSDSLLSVQVHQSLLNNMFERLAPSGEPQRLEDLHDELLAMFGASPRDFEPDTPRDVSIQFSRTRPITVEIQDGRLWLTLRVVRLLDDRDLDLSHFVVRAEYQPVIDGMETRLIREGSLRIEGPRLGFREKLPVRAIFNKVLHKDRPLRLVANSLAAHPAAQHLTVGMLDMTDGWLCMAICPKQADDSDGPVTMHIADLPQ